MSLVFFISPLHSGLSEAFLCNPSSAIHCFHTGPVSVVVNFWEKRHFIIFLLYISPSLCLRLRTMNLTSVSSMGQFFPLDPYIPFSDFRIHHLFL